MREGWAAVVLQRAEQWIGIDLVARAVQVSAAVVATKIVSVGSNCSALIVDV
jgi:hypothetical protein